jgi:hypothetical protein
MSDTGRVIRRRRWTAEEDDLLRREYEGQSAAALGALMDRTEDAIWLRARKLGLEKQEEQRPWAAAELDEVRRCYPLERPAVIAKRLGRTTSAVSQQAAVLGVISRDALIGQSAVHDYFSVIDSAEKAYVLGYLAADGNVTDGMPRVIFGQQAKDTHAVGFVRDRLNPLANLHRRPDGYTTVQVTSRQMVTDLARYGIVPRKSRILQWPADLGPFLRPYLLGEFDGDGSVYVIRNRYPGWSICSGSEQFLIDMKEYIRVSTGVVLEKIHRRPKTDLYQVATTGRGAWIVNGWLHQDGLGLARKHHSERVLGQYRELAQA